MGEETGLAEEEGTWNPAPGHGQQCGLFQTLVSLEWSHLQGCHLLLKTSRYTAPGVEDGSMARGTSLPLTRW